jgi:hypothetical protein
METLSLLSAGSENRSIACKVALWTSAVPSESERL